MGFRDSITTSTSTSRFLIANFLLATPLLFLIVAPIVALLFFGLRLGLAPFVGAVALDALRLSFESTLLTVALAIFFGTPLAIYLSRTKMIWLETLLDLPTMLPPVVAGLGLLFAFGQSGLGAPLALAGIRLPFGFAAVVMAQLFVASPYFVRAAKAGFLAVNQELQHAAKVDGANDAEIFWKIILPASFGTLLEGALMCWTRALGEFGATVVFAGSLMGRTRTMPLAIYGQLDQDLNSALALAALMTILAFGLLAVLRNLRLKL